MNDHVFVRWADWDKCTPDLNMEQVLYLTDNPTNLPSMHGSSNLVNSAAMQAADTRKSALFLRCRVVLFALYRIRSLIHFSSLLSYFPPPLSSTTYTVRFASCSCT